MFAVALWKESERRLVLARDRMGIKPLYIARRGEDLFFGSELKAIFVHPEIERRISLQGLDCYLSLNYVPCPWTLVEGIEKLPAGNWMEWRNGAGRSEAYWKLPFAARNSVDHGRCERGTGPAAGAVRARAYAFGCAAGDLAERRNGFVDDSALCVASDFGDG